MKKLLYLISFLPVFGYAATNTAKTLSLPEQEIVKATLAQDCYLSLTTGNSQLAWNKPESGVANEQAYCLNEAKTKATNLNAPVSKMAVSEQEIAVGAVVLSHFLPKNSQCFSSFFSDSCHQDLQQLAKGKDIATKFTSYRNQVVKEYGLDANLFK